MTVRQAFKRAYRDARKSRETDQFGRECPILTYVTLANNGHARDIAEAATNARFTRHYDRLDWLGSREYRALYS